jgi:hypothetical protein
MGGSPPSELTAPDRRGVAPPRLADAAVALTILILLIGVGYSLWCGSALIWDGSYQLCETLWAGKAYAYLSRFHTLIIWQPVAWLSTRTDNVQLLTIVYGAPFLLAPVVGFTVSWWFVRRHAPMLILWAGLGIMATPLPGQIFVINDSVFQQHLFWPLFLGLMVPLSRLKWVVLAGLSIFQFVHQIGTVLLFGLVLVLIAEVLIYTRPAERQRLWRNAAFAGFLLLISALKSWWTSAPRPFLDYYDSYAAQEASWARIKEAWLYGVAGFPLQGLLFAYAAGALMLLQALLIRRGRDAQADACCYLAALCLVGTLIIWIFWAAVPGLWCSAINYRRWLIPMTVPIYLMAAGEMAIKRWSASRGLGWYERPVPARTTTLARTGILIGLAVLFSVVLGIQSTHFKLESDRLYREVAHSRHATVVVDDWMKLTPLWHWSTSWQVLLHQGRRPQKWIIGGDDAFGEQHLKHLDDPVNPMLPICSFRSQPAGPGPTGWFDLRDVIPAAQRERAAGLPGVAPPELLKKKRPTSRKSQTRPATTPAPEGR